MKSGDTLWVIGFHTHNALGSITHISEGDKLYYTKEACQAYIDKMSWIGMGSRDRYRPVPLVIA